jgi:hypothetical protein
MNILITNIFLIGHSGTEVYVRDLAIALQNRGNHVEVYSPRLGAVAEEIRKAGIHIVDSTADLSRSPDIIHGHHYFATIDVIVRFPNVPVIYFVHDRLNPIDTPPKHSSILKYAAVDYNCLDKLTIDNGIAEKDTTVIYNWVDISRFKLRENFSEKPVKALVFSNYADKNNHFKVIKEACDKTGLELDVVGVGFARDVVNPEDILANYDIVFAKAKAAMEALATGACVIVCDYNGLGETVNSTNFNNFRKFNFGMKTQTRPIEVELIVQEIEKYNVSENIRASELIREQADFNLILGKIINLYGETIDKYNKEGKRPEIYEKQTLMDYWKTKNKIRREKREKEIIDLLKKVENYFFKGKIKALLKPFYRNIFK